MNIIDNKNSDKNDEQIKRMQKARSELLLSHPFFGSIALKLELKADLNCENLWSDGKSLAFNPNFISILSHEHIMASQAHEILHIACSHHLRRNGRDRKLWNRACDYAINSLLLEAGFSLPEKYLKHDKAYDNLSVDEIYVLLGKMSEHDIHGGAKSAQIAEETKSEQEENSKNGSVNLEQEQEGKEDKNKNSKPDQGDQEQDNKGKNKASTEGEVDSDNSKNQNVQAEFFGEIKDHPLLSEENNQNKQKAEIESLIQLTQAMQSAKNHGNLPLGLLRIYNSLIRPSLDWQSLLQRFIENCNDGDYSWSMPNRRYLWHDIYLPSRKEPRIPIMALAIDASGSVDNQLLSVFCKELENILESYDTNLFIMYHDTKVQGHDVYTRNDRPLNLSVQGGGGTDYRDIPDYLEKNDINPSCLLWFTDFECDLFPEEPPYPVLWICSDEIKQSLPFGEAISLKKY